MADIENEIRRVLAEIRAGGPSTVVVEARAIERVRGDRSPASHGRRWLPAVAAAVACAVAATAVFAGTRALHQAPAGVPKTTIGPAIPLGYSALTAYDEARHVLVLYSQGAPHTWTWDGTSWQPRPSNLEPREPISGSAMAYDPSRRQIVLVGQFGWLYTWDGTWHLLALGDTNPGAATLAYDPAAHRLVRYVQGRGAMTWSGETWVPMNPQPPALRSAAIAFDGRSLILVGNTPGGSLTLAWDGRSWSRAGSSTSPPAAVVGGLTRDRTGLLLYGGMWPFPDDDTWQWDAGRAAWQLLKAAHTPGTRHGESLAYDTTGGTVLLYGGYGLNDLWAWNGDDWIRQSGTTSRPRDYALRMPAGTVATHLASLPKPAFPLLFPAHVPAGLTNGWVHLDNSGTVDYGFYDDARSRAVEVDESTGIGDYFAPPPLRHQTIGFRGLTATYFYWPGPPVVPLSLDWYEGQGGYIFGVQGLDQADFWLAAYSLRPLAARG